MGKLKEFFGSHLPHLTNAEKIEYFARRLFKQPKHKVGGFRKSKDDTKDWLFGKVINTKETVLPKRVWRDTTIITNQGAKGACTGFGGAYHKGNQELASHNGKFLLFSQDFLYTLAQKLDGIDHTKAGNEEGSTPKAIMQALQQYGVCLASTLSYNPDPKAIVKIDIKAYNEAKNYRIKNYVRVKGVEEMKQAIALGKTILSGVIVTDTFMYPEDGFVGLPSGKLYGGHCIDIQDYDDELTHTYKNGKTLTGFFRFPNSWDTTWGDKGFGYLPYEFINTQSDVGYWYYMEGWTSVDLDSDPVPPTPTPQPEPPKPEPKPEPPKPSRPDSIKLYHVQVGAFSVRENAEKMQQKLKNAGFSSSIKYE